MHQSLKMAAPEEVLDIPLRMLTKMGYIKGRGLGSKSNGIKYPIQAEDKRKFSSSISRGQRKWNPHQDHKTINFVSGGYLHDQTEEITFLEEFNPSLVNSRPRANSRWRSNAAIIRFFLEALYPTTRSFKQEPFPTPHFINRWRERKRIAEQLKFVLKPPPKKQDQGYFGPKA